jgi:putative hemolysin
MERGTGYPILVNNGGSAYMGDQCGIWVDWNQDEDFADAGEFFSTTNPTSGEIWTFISTITPPAGALLGSTRMRVRLMYTGTLSPCGSKDEGEVEDYTITVVPPSSDYCEASGECGEYIGSVQVGTIDRTSGCTNYDDYTGFSTTMQRGTGYPIIVTNGGSVFEGDQCGIWVDWNQDDDFGDAGESFSTIDASGGIFTATITPPAGATLGDTRMRIRIAFTGPLGPCGPYAFGEVEDYTINVTAAAVDYCTASGGCREYIGSVQLRTIDNTSVGCTGYTDYTHISTTVERGSSYPMTVTNGGSAFAGDQCGIWVDWNQDSDFDDVYEQILAAGGPFSFDANIAPPPTAVEGTTRMRVRIMYTGPLSACGPTAFGEVEDYTLNVASPVAAYCAASGGCAEYIGSVEVGDISNASTTCNSYADYTHLSTEMAVAADYPITVTNGGSTFAGDLCGIWIDWNKDMDFEDSNEAITMSGGPITFTATITPPIFAATMLGDTRMRIRIRNAGALEPCGALAFGEVEDYTITVTPIIGDFVSPIGVDFRDYAVLAGKWQLPPGEPSADIAPDGGDNIVNDLDLAALTNNWLLGLE